MHQVENNLLILPKGALLTRELPELTEIVQKRYGTAGPGGTLGFEGPSASAHPIHQAAAENIREAIKTQGELTRIFEDRGLVGADTVPAPPAKAKIPQQGTAKQKETAERSFSEPLRLTLEDCPYLLDHAVVRQPKDWPFKENLNAVVPLTMTIELLADIAQRQEPNRKLVHIRKISAYQWIPVPDEFEGTINGVWKGPDQLDLELEGYANAEFYFADQWPEPPAEYSEDIDIGEDIMEPISAEDLYDGYAFHGPAYQSSTKTLKICSRGIANLTEHKGVKGSLLDIMGQQLGLFLHLTQEENTISFPTRINELNFYDDYTDQQGVFEHTLIITRLSDTAIVGDMVLKRDGRVWSFARNFVCQRFINDRPFWYVSLKPQYHTVAKEIGPGVYYFSGAKSRANIQAMMSKRYIDVEDGKRYVELEGRQQRGALYSRIALKDAIRIHVSKDQDEMPFPVEIFLHHDENGKPFVRGYGELAKKVDGLHVSLSHKGDESVAIVAEHPVGIDIEMIEEKDENFLAAAFTEKERALLKELNSPEDVIRFWIAKEACSKKADTGLKGNPKSYEVQAVRGDIIHVGDDKVQTIKIGEDHIAGWTI
jgi:phosphopantetheinyl transferase